MWKFEHYKVNHSLGKLRNFDQKSKYYIINNFQLDLTTRGTSSVIEFVPFPEYRFEPI